MDTKPARDSQPVGTDRNITLSGKLTEDIQHLRFIKRRHEQVAFALKIITTTLAVSITALLGLQISDAVHLALANGALILGALMSVVAATDAFYNPRALWVRDATILQHLLVLKDDLDYLVVGRQDQIPSEELDKLHGRYQQVLIEMGQSWIDIESRAAAGDPRGGQ